MSSNRGCRVADATRGLQREIQGTRKHIYRLENPYPKQRKSTKTYALRLTGRRRYGHRVWCPNTTPGRDSTDHRRCSSVSYWPISLVEQRLALRLVQPSSFFDLLNHFKAWPEGVMDTQWHIHGGLSYIFHLAATSKRMWLAIRKETTPADEIACRTSSTKLRDILSQEEDGSKPKTSCFDPTVRRPQGTGSGLTIGRSLGGCPAIHAMYILDRGPNIDVHYILKYFRDASLVLFLHRYGVMQEVTDDHW
jgi:hypothetical protein